MLTDGLMYFSTTPRGADLSIVWPLLLATAAIGCVYFAVSLGRFRGVIFGN